MEQPMQANGLMSRRHERPDPELDACDATRRLASLDDSQAPTCLEARGSPKSRLHQSDAIVQAAAIGTPLSSSLRDGWELARWVLDLFVPLVRITPGIVATSVLSFLLSQLLLLVALILPWKLLIFLSSGRLPTTLPQFLATFTSRELVVTLSAAALLAFVVHFLFDAAFGALARRGAQHILEQHRKLGLFNDQRRIAVGFYRHMLRIVAGMTACGLVMFALGSIYRLMLFALASCFLAGLAGIAIWRRIPLNPELRPTPAAIGKFWLVGGFLFLTGWIVADYWRGRLPQLTVALICLLLARQALMCAAQIAQSLQALGGQRSRVDALFRADTPWLPGSRTTDGFQALLAPGHRESWIRQVLAGCGEHDIPISVVGLRIAERGKLAYLIVTAGGNEKPAFLIKLFHRSLDGLVQHEYEILSVATAGWPAPLLLGHNQIERHHCIIFALDGDGDWLDRPQRAAQLSSLRSRLLDCSLPIELVDRYDRSQPRLARRLSTVDWDDLRAVAVSKEMLHCCASVESHWTALLEQAAALPRQLVLPGLVGRMMASTQGGLSPVVCNWSRWRWEPIGSGWPITPESRKALQLIFADYTGPRAELAGINGETVYRAALLNEIERCVSKSNFSAALKAVEQMHGSLADHGLGTGASVIGICESAARIMQHPRDHLPC